MTIRMRLLLSYIAMVLIPVILMFVIAALLAGLFFGESEGSGDFPDFHPDVKGVPAIWETFDDREQLWSGVKFLSRYEPGRLTDSDFLHETDEAFNRLQAGLVVMKEDQVVFASPFVDSEAIIDQLKRLGPEERSRWGERINGRFTVEQHHVTFEDQNSGTLYLLVDMNPIYDTMSKFMPTLFISLLLVVGLTNGILTFFVSRSIIKPLNTLKHAAEQIKEGDLDHRLSLKRKDEIGKVGEAFEEMRKRLKQSLQLQLQYEENREDLISSISHDLKTPITGIKACVEGIREGVADTEEKRSKYMQMIEQKTSDMDRLIDELFLFSKLDLKRLPFHFEKTDIVSYMRNYVTDLKFEPRMKDVNIHFQAYESKPLYVLADREKLQRVLMNIVDNSLNYMRREDKWLEFELKPAADGEAVTISITDNGSGIDSEALPNIFDRFYRAEPSRNTLTGGSGLGLAIVKHMIEEHGGSTWAESKAGEGTTISFTLPLHKAEGGGHS